MSNVCLLGHDVLDQKRESALFVMRLREVRRLSQASIDKVVTGCRELFSNTMKQLEAGIRQRASDVGVDANKFDNVLHELKDPFTGLDTKFPCFKTSTMAILSSKCRIFVHT
jgi:hypothetical protein